WNNERRYNRVWRRCNHGQRIQAKSIRSDSCWGDDLGNTRRSLCPVEGRQGAYPTGDAEQGGYEDSVAAGKGRPFVRFVRGRTRRTSNGERLSRQGVFGGNGATTRIRSC